MTEQPFPTEDSLDDPDKQDTGNLPTPVTGDDDTDDADSDDGEVEEGED